MALTLVAADPECGEFWVKIADRDDPIAGLNAVKDPVDGAFGAGMFEDAAVKVGRRIASRRSFPGDQVPDVRGAVASVLDVFQTNGFARELERERGDVADGVHASGLDGGARARNRASTLTPPTRPSGASKPSKGTGAVAPMPTTTKSASIVSPLSNSTPRAAPSAPATMSFTLLERWNVALSPAQRRNAWQCPRSTIFP